MTDFVHTTIDDMRGGRHSWRVLLALSLPAFAAGVLIPALQHIL